MSKKGILQEELSMKAAKLMLIKMLADDDTKITAIRGSAAYKTYELCGAVTHAPSDLQLTINVTNEKE